MRKKLLVAAVVGTLVFAGGVSAHGWSVTADTQVTSDGTIVLGHLTTLKSAYVAVHVDDGGEPGRVVGFREFRNRVFEGSNVAVEIDGEYWSNRTGPTDLWIVVHESDTDGRFEPASDDPPFVAGDRPIRDRVTVAPGDRSVRVVAPPVTTNGTVTIRRVDLARDGFLVLYEHTDDGRGDVVGVTALDAGHHENVTVDVDPFAYNDAEDRLTLVAAVGVDSDDGTPGEWDDTDSLVRVDDAPVQATFDATKGKETIPTPEPTPTPTPSETATTPTSETPSRTATTTGDATATGESGPTTTDTAPQTTESNGVPGFGPVLALLAITLALATLRYRNRTRR